MNRMYVALAAFGAAMAPVSAQAVTIISNYPVTADAAGSSVTGPDGAYAKAAGFTIAANGPSYTLNSVTMRLDVQDVAARFTLRLYGTSGGNPGGGVLDTFVIPAFASTGVADYTFNAASAFTLAASSTYWIAATGTSTDFGGIDWLDGNPNTAPTGLAASAGYRFNNNGTYPPTGSSTVFNTYSVDATANVTPAVPEPATWAMMLVGFGMVAGAARYRRRSVELSLA